MAFITEEWDRRLGFLYLQNTMPVIGNQITKKLEEGQIICPPLNKVFEAYKLTSPDKIKVLILSQEPYYTKGTADGLAFSANTLTPALSSIFAEIKGSTGAVRTKTNLDDWAEQGVFLLNMVLTTSQGLSLSHTKVGWEKITVNTLQYLNRSKDPIAVLLWGRHIIEFQKYFDGAKHLILKAPHPSYDYYNTDMTNLTFRGCNHFSAVNEWLQSRNKPQIKWGDPINKNI